MLLPLIVGFNFGLCVYAGLTFLVLQFGCRVLGGLRSGCMFGGLIVRDAPAG